MNENDLLLAGGIFASVLAFGFLKYAFNYNHNNRIQIHDNYFVDSDQIIAKKDEIKNKLPKDINIFDEVLENEYKKFCTSYNENQLILLKNNITELKIKKTLVTGESTYNKINNSIELRDLKHLTHEMHHASATIGMMDNFIIGGFSQGNMTNGLIIGDGLNEAYTEYLTTIMEKRKPYAYNKLVELIPLIELLFENKEQLKDNYFNADLPAVIKRIEQISSKEKSIKLITDMDILCFYEQNNIGIKKRKTNDISLDIRMQIYDIYKQSTGFKDIEHIFFDDEMLERLSKSKRLKI